MMTGNIEVYAGSTRIVPIDIQRGQVASTVDALDVAYYLVTGPPSVDGDVLFEATDADVAVTRTDGSDTASDYEVTVPATALSQTGTATEEVRVSYDGAGTDWSTVALQRTVEILPAVSDAAQ